MTRFKMDREFYLPRESQGRTNIQSFTAEDAVIYTYQVKSGKPGAMAFHGKAAKPDWHYSFINEEQRQKHIDRYIEGRKARAETMAKWKAERSAPHTLTVGQILVSSWGYDQTNIDYYQVTKILGPHMVEIRPIKSASTGEDGFMTAMCTPVKDAFKGEPMRKKANSTNSVYIASYASASPWDGKPDRYSWYA